MGSETEARLAKVREVTDRIRANPDQSTRAISDAATKVIGSRVATAFFDECYVTGYAESDLTRRPFLNVGAGSFHHKRWRVADKVYDDKSWTEVRRHKAPPPCDYNWDLYSGLPLPESSGFFKIIYCSHVIEHLFDDDTKHLFREMHRLLSPGGTVRLVCPDADLIARAYSSQDWTFFCHYLMVSTARMVPRLQVYPSDRLRSLSAKMVLEWVSLLTHPQNPRSLTPRQCVAFLESHNSLLEAFTDASRQSSRELNQTVGAHVNWFNWLKVSSFLREVGFTEVTRSGYLQSSVPVLRDSRYFDQTDPEMSLYVEARKPL